MSRDSDVIGSKPGWGRLAWLGYDVKQSWSCPESAMPSIFSNDVDGFSC